MRKLTGLSERDLQLPQTATGLNFRNPNMPEYQDWESYLARLASLANAY